MNLQSIVYDINTNTDIVFDIACDDIVPRDRLAAFDRPIEIEISKIRIDYDRTDEDSHVVSMIHYSNVN